MTSRKIRSTLGVLVAAVIGLMLIALPGSAAARDRNHDRIPDRWERHHQLSVHQNQARRDQDRDALKNRQEWKAGMDPRDPDSDDDGVEDGSEGAGMITSFDQGVLTINLFHGGAISGLVTGDTEIKCDNGDDQGDEDGDGEGGHHGETGDGDHEGDGGDGDHADKSASVSEHGSGDDDGEPGDDQGDDDDPGDDDQRECSADHLTSGTVVQEADLELEHGQAVFEEIELAE